MSNYLYKCCYLLLANILFDAGAMELNYFIKLYIKDIIVYKERKNDGKIYLYTILNIF